MSCCSQDDLSSAINNRDDGQYLTRCRMHPQYNNILVEF